VYKFQQVKMLTLQISLYVNKDTELAMKIN